MFELGPSENSLRKLASKYDYQNDEAELLSLRKPIIDRGCLTKGDLQVVGDWKSPRSAGRIRGNSEDFVEEITRFALSTRSEQPRIEVLTLLRGVAWPTASVVLHFFGKDAYPILDYRALWSVGVEVPPSRYRFEFWWSYVEFTRDLAKRVSLDMRTLDKALWQYSKDYQGQGGRT